jgi:hypothetical protein
MFSYVTLTFVVESMAAANAILRSKRAKQLIKKECLQRPNSPQEDSDSSTSSASTKSLVLNIESEIIGGVS